MAKLIKTISIISVVLFAAALILYAAKRIDLFLTLAITFGTIAYHFCIRLLIGLLFNCAMKNRADYRKSWYQPKSWERKLYDALRVKQWKKLMPTYDNSLFDSSIHSLDEIAQAMCQSELVHETITVFSLVPILFSIWFGVFWVFFITSVLGALFDLMFVIMQRYNRPRIVKIIDRTNKKHKY